VARGLKSAKVKLVRAAKQLRAIKRSIAAYSASNPHKIVAKPKGNKQLNVPKAPPIEISILAGEAIYHMRSALDHLVFDVIQRNPHVPTIDPEWEEHCEFPLWTKPLKAGQTTPLPKTKFDRCLPGIADAPFTFIESIQPYYGVGSCNNALRFLAHLSNIDKHRRLNLTLPRIQQYESVRYCAGLTGRGHMALDRGAEIKPFPSMTLTMGGKPEKPMYVKRHYRAFVAFNERRYLGEASALGVDYLLELILNEITTHIVPAFEKFIKKP
jgi:hypothetical protein